MQILGGQNYVWNRTDFKKVLNNFMNRIWLRFIKILDDIAFHQLREDGLGGFWDGDGSLYFATITQRH